MPISPLDAYEDHFPVGYVAFYRRTLDRERLMRSLETVAAACPLLTGRMTRSPRGPKAIALSDEGIGFEWCESRDTLGDWRDPDRNAIGGFVRLPFPQDPRRRFQPLMTVRLTQLAGGGSVLGVGLGHVLADGTGIAQLLRDWARVARGERIEPSLWHRREQAEAFRVDGFEPERVPVRERTYLGLHEASIPELGRLYLHLLRRLPEWVGLTIPIRGEHIEDLKAQVNGGATERLSSNDVLSAFLWKLLDRALWPEGSRRSRFFGVTDLRRHAPGAGDRAVFGNMSGHLLLETKPGGARALDVAALATRLRAEARAIAPERFCQQEVWLRHRQLNGRMTRVLGAEPYPGDVAVSNCRYIPFYDIDFGGGRPYFFNLPAEKFPRIVVWPAADGDGCVLNVNVTRDDAAKLVPFLARPRPLDLASVGSREGAHPR